MAYTFKQLAQLNTASTSAVALYALPSSTTAIVKQIIVCNNNSGSGEFAIYNDDNGTTATAATALFLDCQISGDATQVIDCNIYMSTASGTLYCNSGTSAVTLTFTVYGIEIT